MRPAKAEASKGPPSPEPEQTPFDRFVDFTRRILAVPHSEIAAEERKYQKRRAKQRKKHI